MKCLLASLCLSFGLVNLKPQFPFRVINNCNNGATCNTDVKQEKNVRIFVGETQYGGSGGSVPLGRPAKPSGTISGDCQYDCDGWPYAQCQMFVSNKYGSSSATCINPFPPGSRTKYSNYPECADIPSGCQRCDDYCAQRDGKTSRNSY